MATTLFPASRRNRWLSPIPASGTASLRLCVEPGGGWDRYMSREQRGKLVKHKPVEKFRVRTALLLAILLAGCSAQEMTASEAIEVANTEINWVLPEMDRSRRTIRTDDADGKWRVTYASPDDVNAGGPLIVEVDKGTRQATIIQMAQ